MRQGFIIDDEIDKGYIWIPVSTMIQSEVISLRLRSLSTALLYRIMHEYQQDSGNLTSASFTTIQQQ